MAKKAAQANPTAWPPPPALVSRQMSTGAARSSSQNTPNIVASPLSAEVSQLAVASQADARRKTVTSQQVKDTSNATTTVPVTAPTVDSHVNAPTTVAQGEDATDRPQPVLPITPKSPDPRSPATGVTNLTAEALLPARSVPVHQDIAVVEELLTSMKDMLGTLGSTFDTLGEQTIKVATLPAAIDAVHQIASVQNQLKDQHKRQEERMMEVKTLLLEEVRTRLYDRLKDTASAIVKEIVQREIEERVRQQLQEQVPESMRDEVVRYKHQIMQVQVSLHNSEARRHNALIRSNSLDEPLRPLLRPPPELDNVFPPLGNPEADGQATPTADQPAARLAPASAAGAAADRVPPMLSITASMQGRAAAGRWTGRTPLSAVQLEPPTPSPLFPRDLSKLTRLSPTETKELMRDYKLVKVRRVVRKKGATGESSQEMSTPVDDKEGEVVEVVEDDEPREETLNRFLSYIGVGFRLVPAPSSPPRPRPQDTNTGDLVIKRPIPLRP